MPENYVTREYFVFTSVLKCEDQDKVIRLTIFTDMDLVCGPKLEEQRKAGINLIEKGNFLDLSIDGK
jgi:hypothetical protein